MFTIIDNDVYKIETEKRFSLEEKITFKIPTEKVYKKAEYDWYIQAALDKIDKVSKDRHLLTYELIMQYRGAIREGFNHQLDLNLKYRYDTPGHRNTIHGIKSYIKRIEKLSTLHQ